MKVTIIPIVIGALEIIPIGLIKEREDIEIRGQVGTIRTTALLRPTRILRRVLQNHWNERSIISINGPVANSRHV